MVVLAVHCAMRTSEFHEESRRLAVDSSCDSSVREARPVNLKRKCGIEHRQVVGMSIAYVCGTEYAHLELTGALLGIHANPKNCVW